MHLRHKPPGPASFGRQRPLVTAFLLPAALCVASACGPEPFEDPCDTDPFGCASSPGLDYLDSCPRDDDLVVEVGHGEREFLSFEIANPVLHSGAQGGEHVFGAIRIANVDPALYDQVQFTLTLYGGPTPCGSDVFTTDDGRCWYEAASRTVLLEGAEATPDASGVIEVYGIVLSTFGLSSDVALAAAAEDPCRRTGDDVGY